MYKELKIDLIGIENHNYKHVNDRLKKHIENHNYNHVDDRLKQILKITIITKE
jgi:hypothetical protein